MPKTSRFLRDVIPARLRLHGSGEVEGMRTGKVLDPTVGQAATLAVVFGVPPSYLVDGGKGRPVLDDGVMDALADETANATTGADTIDFAIPGTGVKTIAPDSALPVITEAVSINGYSQPGATPNTLAKGTDAKLKPGRRYLGVLGCEDGDLSLGEAPRRRGTIRRSSGRGSWRPRPSFCSIYPGAWRRTSDAFAWAGVSLMLKRSPVVVIDVGRRRIVGGDNGVRWRLPNVG